MKFSKHTLVNKVKALWKDESAQGATEYILLLAIVVSLVMLFGPKIKSMVSQKMEEISGAVSGIKPSADN
jgi:Flp pilus assembly pilin Flp